MTVNAGVHSAISFWISHGLRLGKEKITASKCHQIVTFTGRNSPVRLANSIISPPQFSTAATMLWIANKHVAVESHKSFYPDAIVSPCGFFIDLNYGFLVKSPEGITTIPNVGVGIIECKAPISFSGPSLEDALIVDGKVQFCLQLKRNRAY